MLSVAIKPITLSVIMLNAVFLSVIFLNVLAPVSQIRFRRQQSNVFFFPLTKYSKNVSVKKGILSGSCGSVGVRTLGMSILNVVKVMVCSYAGNRTTGGAAEAKG
jgi:hypothetical protein